MPPLTSNQQSPKAANIITNWEMHQVATRDEETDLRLTQENREDLRANADLPLPSKVLLPE